MSFSFKFSSNTKFKFSEIFSSLLIFVGSNFLSSTIFLLSLISESDNEAIFSWLDVFLEEYFRLTGVFEAY